MKKVIFVLLLGFIFLFADSRPVVLLHTTKGDIKLELYPKVAPMAVKNFMTLVKNGYYNGIIFHRIIKGFMIQSGDPTGTGTGGESIWHKPFKDEFKPGYDFDKPGVLAMANRGPNTNGSQFFITTGKASWLNGHYTIFGHVVGSMSALDKLNDTPTLGRGENYRPINPPKILKASILR